MRSCLLILSLVSAPLLLHCTARAETVEERASTVGSSQVLSPFLLNPAELTTDSALASFLYLVRNRDSAYQLNPQSTSVGTRHQVAEKDYAFAGQLPLEGAAFGLGVNQYQRLVSARNDTRGEDQREQFTSRDYKMKFVMDLTSALRGGFQFRYQSLNSELFGSYTVSNTDRTRYKGNMSGYGLGLHYKFRRMALGIFTSPPLRGKATIEGEQKIITEPGLSGLDLHLNVRDDITAKISVLQWSYKRDDRDDNTTSPIDQSDILLRGLDLDQYYRKTTALAFVGSYRLHPLVVVKGSLLSQSGVFLFQEGARVGQDPDAETAVNGWELRSGVGVRQQMWFADMMLSYHLRAKNRIPVNRVGIQSLGDYRSTAFGILLQLGATL